MTQKEIQKESDNRCISNEVRKQYLKEYRKKNKEKIAKNYKNYYLNNRDTLIKQMKDRYEKTKPRTLYQTINRNLNNIKSKCKLNGTPFDITIDDIVIPDVCPLLGIELKAGLSRNSAQSPSIDKIVPNLGYVRGNVWIVSYRANKIKTDASLDELKTLVKNLEKKMSPQTQSSHE